MQFELRKSRVSAEVLALVEVREALIRSSWTIAYNVEYAGLKEFAIEVPKAIADDVQIDGANIKERIKPDGKNAQGQPNGAVVWRVVLQDKVLGAYELHLSHDTEVLQTKWTLWLPSDFRYVKFDGSMRETIGRRGWDRFWSRIRLFIPRVGPPSPGVSDPVKSEPPTLPEVKTAGFDTQIQKEGVSVTLRRLNAPAAIRAVYRGKTYAATIEAIVCFLALFGDLRLLGRSRQTRFAYFAFVGLGALIIAGAVNPRAAGFWQAIYVGVFLSALIWLVCGVWQWLRTIPASTARLFARKPAPPQRPPPVYPPPMPPEPPSAPPTGDAPTAS